MYIAYTSYMYVAHTSYIYVIYTSYIYVTYTNYMYVSPTCNKVTLIINIFKSVDKSVRQIVLQENTVHVLVDWIAECTSLGNSVGYTNKIN